MPMGILQYLSEVNGTNDPNKSVKLFRTGKATLEDKINTAVNDVFKQNNLIIRDQDTGLPRKFTVGLLRKNVFSAIDDEFGSGVANRVLGHATKGDVGLTHYKVERTSRSKLDVNTLAAEQFNSTYLADIGQSSPQTVMKSYRFSEKFFPVEPVAKLTTPSPVEEAAQKTGLNLETKAVQVGANVENVVKDTDKQIGKLEGQLGKLQNLQTQVDELKGKKQSNPFEAPKSSGDLSQSIKDKLAKFGIKLGKVVTGAIGVEAARQLVTDPAAFAKDVVIDTALERGIGTGPGAVVGFSLAPTEMGRATLDDSQVGEYTRIPLEEEEGFINQNQIGRQ